MARSCRCVPGACGYAPTFRRKVRVVEHEWRSSERDAHGAAMVAAHFSLIMGAATSMAASGVEVSVMLPLGSHRCRR